MEDPGQIDVQGRQQGLRLLRNQGLQSFQCIEPNLRVGMSGEVEQFRYDDDHWPLAIILPVENLSIVLTHLGQGRHSALLGIRRNLSTCIAD